MELCYDCQRPECNCICHERDEDNEYPDWHECDICGGIDGDHALLCPENESPYANLVRDGYD